MPTKTIKAEDEKLPAFFMFYNNSQQREERKESDAQRQLFDERMEERMSEAQRIVRRINEYRTENPNGVIYIHNVKENFNVGCLDRNNIIVRAPGDLDGWIEFVSEYKTRTSCHLIKASSITSIHFHNK